MFYFDRPVADRVLDTALRYKLYIFPFDTAFAETAAELFFGGVTAINIGMVKGMYTIFHTGTNHLGHLLRREIGSPDSPVHNACNDGRKF
jgi:hypothetical protein